MRVPLRGTITVGLQNAIAIVPRRMVVRNFSLSYEGLKPVKIKRDSLILKGEIRNLNTGLSRQMLLIISLENL